MRKSSNRKSKAYLRGKMIMIMIINLLIMAGATSSQDLPMLMKPDRVFDGEVFQEGWIVVVEGDRIVYAGQPDKWKGPHQVVELTGATLIPGMIEGHAHMFLYPYNQTDWNDQVLKESESYRAIRASRHAEKTLLAGFTAARDLGTEGAGFADVGLKAAIEEEVIEGPRLLISTKAIVTTGSYGPKGFAPHVRVPLGASVADGHDNLIREVRDQIGHGADFIKVYADYRWGPEGQAMPTFTLEELKLIVDIAESSGRYVVAHASSAEGMRRAILAGVETIEHGDGGTPEIWSLMNEYGVALCPTLAAGDAILQYQGWKKGVEPEPQRIKDKKASFAAALNAGVTIVAGGDVGVFEHGDNVRELELMVEYGMQPTAVLQSVTSGNARIFHLDDLGSIRPGMMADLVAVEGHPGRNIGDLRMVTMVMKGGLIKKHHVD